MTDEQIAYGIEKLKESGIILSGDAEKQGIGAMTQARWKSVFDSMVNTGLSQPNVNYQDAFTLQFVNHGK
ncbi:putative secreted protein [Calothrix brevissima NIES-22]|nr:putative secreted protein [Calothrix brevissima NIES-22]